MLIFLCNDCYYCKFSLFLLHDNSFCCKMIAAFSLLLYDDNDNFNNIISYSLISDAIEAEKLSMAWVCFIKSLTTM